MAAGLGFKTFTTGEVLTAADTNGYLMQGVLVFASSAARAAAITSPQEGQYSYLKDTNSTEYYDGAAWIAAPIGDITGVTAGTGISGGGTSGTVTITNSMATEITAKGDLIAGTGSATFDNLPVGTNGQTLVADSSTATGLKWDTPASGSTFVGCSLFNTASISTSNNITTTFTFDSEAYDTDAFHSTSSNTGRITIPAGKGGKYLISGNMQFDVNTTGDRLAQLFKNGSFDRQIIGSGTTNSSGYSNFVQTFSFQLSLSAADYIELKGKQNSGGALNMIGGADGTTFQVQYLGA